MTPQGSTVYASAQIDSAIAQINSVNTAVDLQKAVTPVFASVQAQVSAIEAQVALLTPVVELFHLNPADLPSVITFLTTLKTALLGPLILPYTTYIAQVAEIGMQISRLTAAIAAAESRLSSSVTVPSITLPTIPVI